MTKIYTEQENQIFRDLMAGRRIQINFDQSQYYQKIGSKYYYFNLDDEYITEQELETILENATGEHRETILSPIEESVLKLVEDDLRGLYTITTLELGSLSEDHMADLKELQKIAGKILRELKN